MARLVLTQLRRDDELGSFPGHIVPRERNLELLYRRTPRQIAADNGVDASLPIHEWTRAIEGRGGMLERAGSKRWTGVRYLVDENTRIMLPEGGPRPAVRVPPPQPGTGITPGDVGLGLGGLALIGAGLWAFFGD
jgi:hypothetical protein